jgi:hypothetical protein
MSQGIFLEFPSFAATAIEAVWPVWRDSTKAEVKFQPLPRREARRRWHEARRMERQTRQPGKQDGKLGRNGLAVLYVLLFDFLNFATGKLIPSYEAIGNAACISERSVARGLVKLKDAGVLNWLRRCAEDWVEGKFVLRQLSNAYAVLPPSQWRGYRPRDPAPASEPGTWGDHPPQVDPDDPLERALALLGRGVREKPRFLPGCQPGNVT